MENNIEEIRKILSNVNFTQFDIQETKDLLKYLEWVNSSLVFLFDYFYMFHSSTNDKPIFIFPKI